MQELFFSLEGRIGRGKWWLGVISLIVAQWIIAFIMAAAGLINFDPQAPMSMGAAIAQLVLLAIFIWPSICVYGKRYHDRDKSAWWILIVLIPIIGWLWQIIELGLLKGTEGPNRFGPDPLG